jgi:hypothetical protein
VARRVFEKKTVDRFKRQKMLQIKNTQREHYRKEEPSKAPWFHAGGALNFITAVPHCGKLLRNVCIMH